MIASVPFTLPSVGAFLKTSILDFWPLVVLAAVAVTLTLLSREALERRFALTDPWRSGVSALVGAVGSAGLLLTLLRRDFVSLVKEHWTTLLVVADVVIGLAALLILLRGQPRRLRAMAGLLVSAVFGLLFGLSVFVLEPSAYDAFVQEDHVDPRNQVGIALLPLGDGPLLVRRTSDGKERVQLINLEDGTSRRVLHGDRIRDPTWSPDGKTLAYAETKGGTTRIYRVEFLGGKPQALTKGVGGDGEPVWSPDGTQIAFSRGQIGRRNIYVVNADGSGAFAVTTDLSDESSPTWSADGGELAFVRRAAGTSDIYVANLASGVVSKLIDYAVADQDPAWSPDGSEIAFASNRDGDFEIYRYVIGYQGARSIIQRTRNKIDDRSPAWSPDGGEIAYLQRADHSFSLRLMNRLTQREDSAVNDGELIVSRLSWRPVPKKNWKIADHAELRFRYAPVAYLHPSESYWPISAATFVRRSRLFCGNKVLAGQADQQMLGRPPLAYPGRRPLPPAFRCARPRLDLEDGSRRGKRVAEDADFYRGVPLYSERNEYKSGLAITYWFFYAYSIAGGRVGAHEADWERVTVCFLKDRKPGRYVPKSVIYHQHDGFEVRPWRWAPKLDSHPVVYIAKGSHASYPNAGRRVNTQDLTDEGRVWPTWWALRPLRAEPWYNFRGSWGGPQGPSIKKGGAGRCLKT